MFECIHQVTTQGKHIKIVNKFFLWACEKNEQHVTVYSRTGGEKVRLKIVDDAGIRLKMTLKL